MRRRGLDALGTALAAALALPAAGGASIERPVDAAAIEELLRSARLWESLGYPEIERQVLRKLLAVQGDEPRALLMLGELELRAGQVEAARRALAALRRIPVAAAATRELQALERIYVQDGARLAQLRLLVRGGNTAQARSLARALFPDGRPPGDLADEFAPLLASSPEGWDRTRAYLEERIAAEPTSIDRLTLYELLAQRAQTREQALRGFADLARARDVEPERVARAWRSALAGLGEDDAGLAERRRYLERYPADQDMRRQVARAEAARLAEQRLADDPGVLARQAAQRALDAGALDEAEAQLKRSLALRPDDGESIGTLGLLRLRQGRDDEALQQFAEAAQVERSEPGLRARWLDLAKTARYWGALQRARALRDQGHFDEAARTVQAVRAEQREQDEHDEAGHFLAELRAAQGQDAAAEALYRELVQRDATDRRAWRGWFSLRLREGRVEAALDEASDLQARTGVAPAEVLDAGALRDAIDAASTPGGAGAGHPDTGLRLRERAVALLPREPWLRYDLAQQYRRLNLPTLARQVMEEGLRQAPQDPSMGYAAALVDAATDHDDAALARIESIGPAARTEGMRSLAQRLRFERDLRLARDARAAGDARLDAQLRARALAEAGADPARRLRVARADLSAGDMAGTRSLLDALAAPGVALSDEQRRDLADAFIDAGQIRAARAQIDALAVSAAAPGHAAPPSDEAARRLLLRARLHLAEHDDAAARADWRALRALLAPDEISLHLEALRQMDRDPDLAHDWLADLLARHPRDPDVLLEAGREARRAGRYEDALAFLRAVGAPPAASPALGAPLLGPPVPPLASGGERDEFLLGLTGGVPAAGAAVPEAQDAQARAHAQVQQIEARRQPHIDTALMGYTRIADEGISTLRGVEVPVVGYWPMGYDGHWFAQVDSAHVEAGTLPAAYSAAAQFGKVYALAPGGLERPVAESQVGLSAAAGWRGDDRRFDLGVVGMGFKVPNVVGGWRESGTWRDTDLSAELSRRVVVSSLLSYAGAADPVTGAVWGGVTNTALTLRAGREFAHGWSGSTSLSLGLLAGREVESNSGVQSRTVIDRDWIARPDFRLNAGGVLSIWHYAHNEDFYTFGQGGYYSPQRYISLGVPIEVEGRHGELSYDLRAVPSRSWSYQQNVPYYPTDGLLQARAGNPIQTSGNGPGGGPAGSLRGDIEYRAAAHWTIGAWLDIDRSAYYAPTRLMIYLRYWIEPQRGPVDFPPRPVTPISLY